MCGVPFKKPKESSQLASQIFANVKIGNSRAAAKPFQNSANGEIDAERAHVNGNRAGALENIQDYVRTNVVGPFDDGARVDDARAAEEHQRDRHQQGGLVDGREKSVEVHAHVAARRNSFDACAEAALLVIKILH